MILPIGETLFNTHKFEEFKRKYEEYLPSPNRMWCV